MNIESFEKPKTLGSCKSSQVKEVCDTPVKYKLLYGGMIVLLVVAPVIAGPLIACNERRLTNWGWLPSYVEVHENKL